MKQQVTLRCMDCGRFIAYKDLEERRAIHYLVEPSSHFGEETWLTLCPNHVDTVIGL